MCALSALAACAAELPPVAGDVVINEVCSDNDGAAIDELGEADDYIELANLGDEPARLDAFLLRDSSGRSVLLPRISLAPHAVMTLWADDDAGQGAAHLPFKLSAGGETIALLTRAGGVVDEARVPALEVNETFARLPSGTGHLEKCRFATPGRSNGEHCEPAPPPELSDDFTFAPYEWPSPWPAVSGPLVLNELLLRPARSIEVLNASDEAVALDDFFIGVSDHRPGQPWPTIETSVELAWPEAGAMLGPNERVVVSVPEAAMAKIAMAGFEGVASIFARTTRRVNDRIDFMAWPEGAALTRWPEATGQPHFCSNDSLGARNTECDELESRAVADHMRDLYVEGDFEKLAAGDTSVNEKGVKFVIDLAAGGVVYFLSSAAWALHFTFVHDVIENLRPFNRCNAIESMKFNEAWYQFSQAQYANVNGRRYLLGTLERHAGTDLWTVAFTLADQINGPQMVHAFFTVLAKVRDPKRFALRPSEPRQVAQLMPFNGQLPIIGMNTPYQGVTYQALTEGVGYGVLKFVPAAELGAAPLGRDVIVVTDDVPNDIPLVGGLITEALQTPLAHVNILSKSRNTPNMALRAARSAAEIEPMLDKLVRLEVKSTGFSVREASGEEAAEFYASREPTGARVLPRIDTSVRGIVPLEGHGLEDLPAIGAKAAQLAELARVNSSSCGGPMPTPPDAFAIPVVYSLEHYERSGITELLREQQDNAEFVGDPAVRAQVLAQVQDMIMDTPVDRDLLASIIEAIDVRYGDERVRMRSSSNTEDLPAFNGAGLYTSVSVELGDPERMVADGLRTVWASLFSLRAFDERELAHIDQTAVAMGVLVHNAFLSERANSVAISRNILDPTRTDMHYFNIQRGEASVANPAPGVVTEQLTRRLVPFEGSPEIEYQSYSSFSPDTPIMTPPEIRNASCYLARIHDHFRAKIDPKHENQWFAVDIELKLVGENRELLIKQARPYSFGKADVPADCRTF